MSTTCSLYAIDLLQGNDAKLCHGAWLPSLVVCLVMTAESSYVIHHENLNFDIVLLHAQSKYGRMGESVNVIKK